ncbi:putative LRR receptor-like serine/threonine-protein kinase At2g24230 [Curcuma longa]|uniref:putative LRR receptor-like serine/threonine-protein kinase At2g24230 n=1 Tax=Curcuma longa TaxID=136217 RepID=UPI003D9DE100
MGGVGFFAFYLSFFLLLRRSWPQSPPPANTDAFYVFEFFREMRVQPSSRTGNSSDVCSWRGIICDSGGSAGAERRVIALEVPGLQFAGPISETTIGKLRALQSLDLSRNAITALPMDLAELGELARLNLSSNNLTGLLPPYIGNFNRMESLDLSGNGFSGEVPAQISALSRLKVLNLSRNSLESGIPEAFLQCISLVSIDLSSNKLNRSLPARFGSAFKNLSTLVLSDNQINGGLPDLSSLDSLTYLDLSGNHFNGNISQAYHWSSLVHLDLSMNELSEGFFTDLVNQLQSLKHLNLAFNEFSAQKFDLMRLPPALEYLNLSKSNLDGQIPTRISQLHELKVLDISQNHIDGRIPDLSTENLQVIDLSVNNLTGEIPISLRRKLLSMETFNFSYNNLTYCGQNFSFQVIQSSFIGSQNHCPIAVNPDWIRSKGSKDRNLKLGLAIALPLFLLAAGSIWFVLSCRKRPSFWAVKQISHREEKNVSGPFRFHTDATTWVANVKHTTSVPVVIFEKPLLNFTFADLLNVTNNFDRETLLAEGRFGPVYRGLLPGGIHVAMKVLLHRSTISDEDAVKELERLGQIKHPNLVPLTGYCLAGGQRIVIYDYMENGNLQSLLHDLPLGVQSIEDWTTDDAAAEGTTSWSFRHSIALGTARALAFLHHGCFPQIVHADVKASSIYLDSAMDPRLADSGLSNIIEGTATENDASQGPSGYAPPEFSEAENASATIKSDVYGFGVVLFELTTGKKPIGDDYAEEGKSHTLVSWARALVKRNELSSLIDPKIRETGSEKQMEEALRIAYLCTAELPSKRPSMQQIVGLLKDIEPVNEY